MFEFGLGLLLFVALLPLFFCGKKKTKSAENEDVDQTTNQTTFVQTAGFTGTVTQTTTPDKPTPCTPKTPRRRRAKKTASVSAETTPEEKSGEEFVSPQVKLSKKEKKKLAAEEKKAAEKLIMEAIKNGEFLPQDDYETVDDCETNWGTVVAVPKKNKKN